MLAPVIDGGLGILRRLDVRFLIGQVEVVEDFPDIGMAVIDAPFFANEIGDDPRGPTVGQITGRPCSGKDDGFEFLKLFRREFGGSPGTGFSCEGLKTALVDFLLPSFDGGERSVEKFDDFVVVESAQDQLPGLESDGRLP